MLSTQIQAYALIIPITLVVPVVGWLLAQPLRGIGRSDGKVGIMLNLALHYAVGLSAVAVLVAVFHSTFVSAFTVPLLAYIGISAITWVKYGKMEVHWPTWLNYRTGKMYVFTVLIVMLVHYALGATENGMLMRPHVDDYYYAKQSFLLVQSGIENRYGFMKLVSPETWGGIMPYHWYELWIAGYLAHISGLPALHVLVITVCVLPIIGLSLGLMAVVEYVSNSVSIRHMAICILLLLAGPVFMNIFKNILHFQVYNIVEASPYSLMVSKNIYVTLFYVVSINLWLRERRLGAVMVIGMLPVVNVATMPAVVVGIAILQVRAIYLRGLRTQWHAFAALIPSIAMIALSRGVDHGAYHGEGTPWASAVETIRSLNGINIFAYWLKTKYVYPALKTLLMFLPLAVAWMTARRSLRRRMLHILNDHEVWIGGALFGGLVAYSLTTNYNPVDARQLYASALPALFAALIVPVLLMIGEERRSRPGIGTWLIIAMIAVAIVGQTYRKIGGPRIRQAMSSEWHAHGFAPLISNGEICITINPRLVQLGGYDHCLLDVHQYIMDLGYADVVPVVTDATKEKYDTVHMSAAIPNAYYPKAHSLRKDLARLFEMHPMISCIAFVQGADAGYHDCGVRFLEHRTLNASGCIYYVKREQIGM